MPRPIGANDAIRIAVVGLHIRGAQLIDAFLKVPGVRIAAICDVDREILDTSTEAGRRRGRRSLRCATSAACSNARTSTRS